MNIADVAAHADVWEEVVRKLRGGLMPPAGIRRPPQAELDTFVASLERALDQAAATNPNPRRVAQRYRVAAEIELRLDHIPGGSCGW